MVTFRNVRDNITPPELSERAFELIDKYSDKLNQNVLDTIDKSADFFFLMHFLNAQQKASTIEKFITEKIGGSVVPSNLDRGDFILNEQYYEVKTSTTNKGRRLNIRQIRPYQEVDFYICSYIEELDIEKSKFFKLTNDEMSQEIELMGGFTHGTKKANEVNTNLEYSITVNVFDNNNTHTQRWNERYWYNELYNIIIQ